MGLAMDRDGIPLHFDLFPGNIPDTSTFRSIIGEVRRNYETGRIIVVADRGVVSGDNIYYLVAGSQKEKASNGYIFSYSISGATEEFREFVLDPSGYVNHSADPNDPNPEFLIKSRRIARDISVTQRNGRKVTKRVYEKQVVFWSRRYADKARIEREKQIAKANAMLSNPAKMKRATSHGAARYIQDITYDEETGEVLDRAESHVSLDVDKIMREASLDGYYAIVTSEFDMADLEVVEHYRGLWEIEETFRVTKSVLETRPVHVSREDCIRAHFLICFIALVVLRLLQKEMGKAYSCERLVEAMKNTSCIHEFDNIYLFGHRCEVSDAIGAALGIDFTKRRMYLHEIKGLLADSKRLHGDRQL
jgi:transposase